MATGVTKAARRDPPGRPQRRARTSGTATLLHFHASLKLLATHAGKVSLVYMDPPYCTGMDFQARSQRHAYSDPMAPSQYVEFMRRRLILCRELLAESGSLYCHIGHQMLGHLKVVLDEVFGADHFRNLIVRRECSSKNHTRRGLCVEPSHEAGIGRVDPP